MVEMSQNDSLFRVKVGGRQKQVVEKLDVVIRYVCDVIWLARIVEIRRAIT